MHEDYDRPVGRIFTRRQALALFSTPVVLALAGCGDDASAVNEGPFSGSCLVRPEMTEGPFYVDTQLERRDLTEDRSGTPLDLSFTVSRVHGDTCAPLEGAVVDVWHADANGDYSGVGPLRGERFLRGLQRTDAEGKVSFATIYPGWYRGRAPHIHFTVRSAASTSSAYEFTSQLFFDDVLSRSVYETGAYAARGDHDVTNQRDGIFRRGRGTEMLLDVSEAADGFAAAFELGMVID